MAFRQLLEMRRSVRKFKDTPLPGELLAKDCALAASYLMLSTASRGLGSCWIELGRFIRDPDLIRGIRLPEGAEIHAPLVVGYPAINPAIPKRNPPDIINLTWKRNQHGHLYGTH